MRALLSSGLPGRTIPLILFWEAYAFSFLLVSSIAIPAPFVCVLAASALLVAMHQAFHWDIPFGKDAWFKLGRSSKEVRLIYGPVIVVGWLLGKLFTGLLLSVAMIIALPFVAPSVVRNAWREHCTLRSLRDKGRLLDWGQVLHRLEKGDGLLLLEYVYEEAGGSWENLARLWWIPQTELAVPVEQGLPTYRQWLMNRISWEMAHQAIELAHQKYQHPAHGTGALVRIPWRSRKKLKRFLATRLPEASVRVTWINT